MLVGQRSGFLLPQPLFLAPCPAPTPYPMPPECLPVTLRMVVLLSSHKLIMGPELKM